MQSTPYYFFFSGGFKGANENALTDGARLYDGNPNEK